MRLLTIAEAAAELNVPEGWLRKKVTARAVPFTRLGKHVRFTNDDLHAIVVSGQQSPLAETVGNGVSRRARKVG
jgi:excisionase family DNA binding protein